MIKNNDRICDICAQVIPKGEKYCINYFSPDIASVFFSDPELMPTMTQMDDGKIRLDICLCCKISMGNSGEKM